MRIIFLLLVFIVTIFPGNAQNYESVHSGTISYFKDYLNYIHCIRIDSVRCKTDSVLYPFAVIQQLDYDCFSPTEASWIGKKVIIKENGINLFFNRENDTIIINTNASAGDKWNAFRFNDSSVVEATVTDHDTMNFLGLTDSVKTIGFHVYDKNRNPLDYDINEMNLKISKNYGLVKTLNFFLFPDMQSEFLNEKIDEYNLVGLSNPETGTQNLTWFDIYDFQVGDELHVLYESSSWGSSEQGFSLTDKAIYKYLERTNYSDSIIYRISRQQSIYTVWMDSNDVKFNFDTIRTKIETDTLFDNLLPEEPVITDNQIFSYKMTSNTKTTSNYPGLYVSDGDSCWHVLIADGCLTDYEYIKGMGGPYFSCTNFISLGGMRRRPVYCKKGEETWGDPLIVSGIHELEKTNNISISPNPASTCINIEIKNLSLLNPKLSIINISGSIVKTSVLTGYNNYIDLKNLKKGFYILKITDNNSIVKVDKLIIE